MAPLPRLKFTFTGTLLPPTPPHSHPVQKLEGAGRRAGGASCQSVLPPPPHVLSWEQIALARLCAKSMEVIHLGFS